MRDENRVDGPAGRITFALGVRMTQPVKQHVDRLGENLWNRTGKIAGR